MKTSAFFLFIAGFTLEWTEVKTMSLSFNYFYGNESEQFTFYRIPKLLVSSPTFKKLSDGAKLLYGLMLDRMNLSMKNGWFDSENRAYIYYTTNEIMESMSCGTEKATKLLAELDTEKGIGLIERKKQGQGKPTIIYIKNFVCDDLDNRKSRVSETESQDFGKPEVKSFDNQNSSFSIIESADFGKSKCNNTYISNTDINNNEENNTDISETPIISHHIKKDTTSTSFVAKDTKSDAIRWIRERNQYEEIIKDNIEYDILLERFEKAWLDEIVEIMVDVVCSKEPYIRINKQECPQEVVKSRFLKIDSTHIEYIYMSLKDNTSNVRNIRAFLITTIYRSFETSDNWFSAKVSYDMANPIKDWGDT